jgi:hypothetical protein
MRIVGLIPIPWNPMRWFGKATAADWPGIGCYRPYISIGLPDGTSHLLDVEKDLATTILSQNRDLQPAMVLMPCRLSPALIYAQCSFDGGYKEASGKNNFLRRGRIINYMRKHSVASLIAVTPELAGELYSLSEPRIEDSLYLFLGTDETPVLYELARH